MSLGRLLVLVLGLAIAAFGIVGLLGGWGDASPPSPKTVTVHLPPDPAPVGTESERITGGTLTMTQIWEDGGSISFWVFVIAGLALATLAWVGHPRRERSAP